MYRIAIKRIWCYGAAVVGFLLIAGMGIEDPVEGWAVLLETNDFPEGYTDLDVDFIDVERMVEMLTYHGWQEGNIKIKRDEITPETVREGVEYLMKADENDIALFYIGSHGGYIRRDLQWNEIFPPLWNTITAEKKVLIIDSCYSESFLPESDTGISIASVSAHETGWAGTPEEGLPIIGFVFTYFFCESMKDDISVEEGFEKTGVQVAEYMKEVVYPAFKDIYPPERFDMYDPHPVMIDQYPGHLHVDVEHTAPVSAFLVLLGMIIAVKGRKQSADDCPQEHR